MNQTATFNKCICNLTPEVRDTLQPLYNTVCYDTVLDKTQFKDGSQKCIDYIEYTEK